MKLRRLPIFLFLGFSVGAYTAPEIFVENEIYDFGVVYREDRDSLTHTFVIQNIGDEDLKIEQIKPSCGCTRAEISREVIPPGESAELVAELHFKVRVGRNRIRVTVISNDPNRKSLDLGIVGETIQRWSILPPHIPAGVLIRGTTNTYRVTAVSQTRDGDEPVRLDSVRSTHPAVRVTPSADPQTTLKKGYHEIRYPYVVEIRAGTTITDNRQAVVEFVTDSKKVPSGRLTLEWSVEGDLMVRPRSVSLVRTRYHHTETGEVPASIRRLGPLAKSSAEVVVSSRSKTPFRILAATAPKDYRVVWDSRTPSSSKPLRISLEQGEPGRHDGSLVLETDRPDERFLRVSLKGEIDPPAPLFSSSAPTHHFSPVFADETAEVSHTFFLRNSGTKDLILKLILPAEATATLSRSILPPGATAALEIRVPLAGKSGKVRTRVTVTTNDPQTPKKNFTLAGEVLQRWEFDPQVVDFHSVRPEEPERRPLLIRRRFPSWQEPAELQGFQTEDGELELQILKTRIHHTTLGYSMAETEALVILNPTKPAGHRTRALLPRVVKEDFLFPPPEIPVRWSVLGDIGFRPRKLIVFRPSERSSENSRPKSRLKIYSRSKQPFLIEKVDLPEGIRIFEVERRPTLYFYEVAADPPGLPADGTDRYLLFHLDREDQPTLRVDVEVR